MLIPADMPRADCPYCGRNFMINKNNLLAWHRNKRNVGPNKTCAGAGMEVSLGYRDR